MHGLLHDSVSLTTTNTFPRQRPPHILDSLLCVARTFGVLKSGIAHIVLKRIILAYRETLLQNLIGVCSIGSIIDRCDQFIKGLNG